MTTYYYQAKIPTMPNGECVTYPQTWTGEITNPPPPAEVECLLCDDRLGILVARTDSDLIVGCAKRGEVTLLTTKQALRLVDQADRTDEKVFVGETLAHRYDPPIEAVPVSDGPGTPAAGAIARPWMQPKFKGIKGKQVYWCKACAKSYVAQYQLPVGLNAGTITMGVDCSEGHKCKIVIKRAIVNEAISG